MSLPSPKQGKPGFKTPQRPQDIVDVRFAVLFRAPGEPCRRSCTHPKLPRTEQRRMSRHRPRITPITNPPRPRSTRAQPKSRGSAEYGNLYPENSPNTPRYPDRVQFLGVQLQMRGALVNALMPTHRKFTAHPRPLLVNRTFSGIAIQRSAPTIA